MQQELSTFLGQQMDFIFFFYGLAFVLLGTVCFAIAKMPNRREWALFGAFGVLHGVGEWLDLSALVLGDSAAFATCRLLLMVVSLLFLAEYARRLAALRWARTPGPWIHAVLAMVVLLAGLKGGMAAANAAARFTIAFGAATTVSALYVLQTRSLERRVRALGLVAALGVGLYGIAAGLIVPAAPFWPASTFNQTTFLHLTGMPIQLVRGILGCWVAGSIWAVWGRMIAREVSSDAYTNYLRRQFLWAAIAMTAILGGGWLLTEHLGGVYERSLEVESQGDIDLLASRLSGETTAVDAMVRALAGSPAAAALLSGGGDPGPARQALALHVQAADAVAGFLINRSGVIAAASGPRAGPGANPSLDQIGRASAARPAARFAADGADTIYDASYPVRGADGAVVGVAVLRRSLAGVAADLRHFDRAYYLIDSAGVIAMTNQPGQQQRRLWPAASNTREARAASPILPHAVADAAWLSADGHREHVRRRALPGGGWSVVIITPTEGVFASRVLGIIITLLVAVTTLVYLFSRERSARDHVQMDRRAELQTLAQGLRRQATTDALTGLSNRLRFDEALDQEIARARRYETPLALVMCDVDHFKRINDTFGHPAGDRVLVRLSALAAGRIRSNDVLARWGGEEFVLMTPQSDGRTASHVAEKLRAAIAEDEFEEIGRVTCSFGVAELTEGDTAQTLIARADAALYRAKVAGRDRVEFAEAPGAGQRLAS